MCTNSRTGLHRASAIITTAILVWLTNGCVYVLKSVDVMDVPTSTEATYRGPVKVQMHDGSIVVFDRAVSVSGGQITGDGVRHMLDGERYLINAVPLDSAASMQAFVEKTHAGKSLAASTVATLGVGAVAVLACADPMGAKAGACDGPDPEVERVGTTLADLAYVREGSGASTTIKLRQGVASPCVECGQEFAGELLAVTDSALIVLRHKPVPGGARGAPELRACALCASMPGPGSAQARRQAAGLVVVPVADVRSISAKGLGEAENPAEPRVRARARLLSRYPAGITPALLQQLTQRYEGPG